MPLKSRKGNRSGKIQNQAKDGFLKWERGDKRLSKVVEVLIMGLGIFQLFSLSINKSFPVGKRGRKSFIEILQHSNYRRIEKRVIHNVCKFICRTTLLLCNAFYLSFKFMCFNFYLYACLFRPVERQYPFLTLKLVLLSM